MLPFSHLVSSLERRLRRFAMRLLAYNERKPDNTTSLLSVHCGRFFIPALMQAMGLVFWGVIQPMSFGVLSSSISHQR